MYKCITKRWFYLMTFTHILVGNTDSFKQLKIFTLASKKVKIYKFRNNYLLNCINISRQMAVEVIINGLEC